MFSKFNQGRYFCYKVGNKTFYNNIDALIEKSKHPELDLVYEFIGLESIHNSWKEEPPNHIHYYLDKHAKLLEREYDTIILSYSGGTDSHTMLESFIRARVKNVTIVVVISEASKNSYHRRVVQDSIINSLKEKYGTIFKSLNYKVKELIYKTNNKKDWGIALETFEGDWLTEVTIPTNWLRFYHEDHNKSEVIGTNKKTCIVWGHEKPVVQLINGWWYWGAFSGQWSSGAFPTDDVVDNICFFLNDNVPEIQIKLTWLKIDILEKLIDLNKICIDANVIRNLQLASSQYYQTINHYMGYKGLNHYLDSNLYKPGGELNQQTWLETSLHFKETGIDDITKDYFNEVIVKNVDPTYLVGNKPYKPWSKLKPIRKSNVDKYLIR